MHVKHSEKAESSHSFVFCEDCHLAHVFFLTVKPLRWGWKSRNIPRLKHRGWAVVGTLYATQPEEHDRRSFASSVRYKHGELPEGLE